MAETEEFEYILGLVDKMSGPAKDGASALSKLEQQIGGTEAAIRKLTVQQLKYKEAGQSGIASQLGIEIAKARLHLGDLSAAERRATEQDKASKAIKIAESKAAAEEQARASKAAHDALHKVAQADKEAAKEAKEHAKERAHLAAQFGAVALAATAAVTAIAYKGAEFAIEASEFKENTTLAYVAVQGSAEAGEEAFAEINRAARLAHLPVEKAHDFAQTLMLQGVNDTGLIARTIASEAALIRTGQLEGASRLKSIIERSAVVGHFDAGRGKGAARRLAGLGIGPEIAKELASGKLSLEDGLEKLNAAIEAGPIGRAAAKKFGIEDFKTDVTNAFRSIASVDLSKFNSALEEADKYIQQITADGAPLHEVFQNIVDDAASLVTDFEQMGATAVDLVTSLNSIGGAIKDAFGHGVPEFVKDFEIDMINLSGAVDYVVTGFRQVAAFSAASDKLGPTAGPIEAWRALKDGVAQANAAYADYEAGAAKRQELIDRIRNGTEGVADAETAIGIHAKRAAGHVEAAYADMGRAHDKFMHALGPEDLLFKPLLGAYNKLATAADLLDDKQSGGFVAGMSPDSPVQTAIAAARSAPGPSARAAPSTASATGPAAGRGVSLTWYGDLIVDGQKDEGHLRAIANSEFANVLGQFAAELSGADH